MPVFFCTHCKFKYTPKSERKDTPSTCGNCGNRNTLILEPDAEQILKESQLL
ncbi:MAG TPA: hypothetical protein VFE88_01135 [Candidatus Nanoarchaeia archaeon]|nr:hypothetical protein [Candidatus Nanoarchaeia archaeon]